MANLGNVGTKILQGLGRTQGFPGINIVRIGLERHQIGLTKDTTDGSPTQPSMRVDRPHRRSFLWPVSSGTHTISVDVKFTSDGGTGFRPKMVIKANDELGIASDISTEAAAGTGTWKTIGPVSVNPSAQGALEVVLEYGPVLGEANIVHWDSVAVT